MTLYVGSSKEGIVEDLNPTIVIERPDAVSRNGRTLTDEQTMLSAGQIQGDDRDAVGAKD